MRMRIRYCSWSSSSKMMAQKRQITSLYSTYCFHGETLRQLDLADAGWIDLGGLPFFGNSDCLFFVFSAFPAFAAVAFDALVVFGASTFASASLVAFAAFSSLIRFFLVRQFQNVGNLRIRSIPTKSHSPRIISSFIPLFACGSAFRGSACAANSPRLRIFSHPGLRSFLEKQRLSWL